MDLDEKIRPKIVVKQEMDTTKREQCSVCCAAKVAGCLGAGITALTFFPNLDVQDSWRLGGPKNFCNRFFLISLPVSAVCFTHQYMLSQSLWSKNRKGIFDINMQCLFFNVALWCTIIGTGTLISRKVLVKKSRTYRLIHWDYERNRRTHSRKWVPSAYGRLTHDLDWLNMCYYAHFYHVFWLLVSKSLESTLHAHYAMFWKDSRYSKWCSPRWREWRESQLDEQVYNKDKPVQNRWGSLITLDAWRSSAV